MYEKMLSRKAALWHPINHTYPIANETTSAMIFSNTFIPPSFSYATFQPLTPTRGVLSSNHTIQRLRHKRWISHIRAYPPTLGMSS